MKRKENKKEGCGKKNWKEKKNFYLLSFLKLETKQKRLKIIHSFSFIFNSKQIESEAMFRTCEKKKKRIERRKGN